jgi:hypothetical protein
MLADTYGWDLITSSVWFSVFWAYYWASNSSFLTYYKTEETSIRGVSTNTSYLGSLFYSIFYLVSSSIF